ncbi:MAG TPA: ABC transporter transmembrane domain-containing protein, partial [Candidatus Dormibacteraeota bacterium]|nr:ABC transporter transmembrane domain-containing protein [Candidatus Dormibacteraeota bacterium]
MSVWGTFWLDPDDAARSIDLRLLRRGWTFVRPHRVALLLYLLAVGAGALFQVVPALLIRQIVDQALPSRDGRALVALSAALLLVFAVGAVLLVVERVLSARIGGAVILALRLALHRQLQRMPLAFFARARQGMIQSRVVWEVDGVQQLFTSTLSSALTDAVGLIAVFAAMFALSPLTAVVVLLLTPLAVLPARLVARRSRELNRRQNQLQAELSTHVAERLSVSGALLARIFGGQERDLRRFAERSRAARSNTVRMEMLHIGFVNALSLTGSLAVVAIYLVGGSAVIGGSLSLGTLIALATLAQRVYGPIVDLASVRLNLVSGVVALERVVEVLDKEPLVGEPA